VVASKKISKSRGERPVRKNGVEYLIEQDKGSGGSDELIDEEAPARVSKADRKRPASRQTVEREIPADDEAADAPDKTLAEIADDARSASTDADDVISNAERALLERQSAPQMVNPSAPKAVKKAPEKSPVKAPGKQLAKATSKDAKKTTQKASAPKSAKPSVKAAAPKTSGTSYDADEF
jgi:hypothetical protein